MDLEAHDPRDLQAFVSPASLWLPDYLAESAWTEHAPFAFWLMEALRPRAIAELGVHHGFSYFVFCQAVQRLRLEARCFAIDTWQGDENAGFYGEDVYNEVYRHNRRYDGFSRLIRSDFADACGEFADGSIDLLHIDGYHTYEAVRRDFEAWLPKLSARGVVLMHDTAEFADGFGVHRLWNELCGRYPHFAFTHGHGLGVLGVGTDLPSNVRALLQVSDDPAAVDTVRAAYAQLGGFIASSKRVADLTRHAHEMDALVRSYETSRSWRLTAPLRAVSSLVKSAYGYQALLRGSAKSAAVTDAVYGPEYPAHARRPV